MKTSCTRMLVTATILMALSAQAQDRRVTPVGSSGRRVALVIGNDSYPSMGLRNARNDARAMRDTLRDEGFQVDYVEDATRQKFALAMDAFSAKIQRGDVALFYYSGHGLAVDGANYLLPVDFTAQSEADVPFSSYPVLQAQRKLEERGARLNIIILDACRDNPFRFSRSAGGGLTAMREGVGTLIAFAAADGQRASDNGSEANGLFTKHLLEAIREPGLNARDMFFKVQERVYEASSHRQFPYVYAGAVGQFYFRPAAGEPAVTASNGGGDLQSRSDLVYWESIRDSRNPAVFEDYLRRFPDGQFVVPAKSKLDELRAVSQPPVMPRNTLIPANVFQVARYDYPQEYIASLAQGSTMKQKGARFDVELSVSADGMRFVESNRRDIKVPCREVLGRVFLAALSGEDFIRMVVDNSIYYSGGGIGSGINAAVQGAVRSACGGPIPVIPAKAAPSAPAPSTKKKK